MKKTDKKLVAIVTLLILLLLAGCQIAHESAEQTTGGTPEIGGSSGVSDPDKDIPEDGPFPILEDCNEGTIPGSEEVFWVDRFAPVSFHKNWIYYGNNSGELRKCKLDLTQDSLVYSGRFAWVLSKGGRSITGSGLEWYLVDTCKGEIKKYYPSASTVHAIPSPAPSTASSFYKGIVYKDNVFFHRGIVREGRYYGEQIDMYDLEGNYFKTVAMGNMFNFSVVDDNIYYISVYSDMAFTKPDNKIMRYDIKTGETEQVFEFDLKKGANINKSEYFEPCVYFCNRTIIVKNSGKSFVYTSIDNIEPREVVFDFETGQGDWFELVPGIGEDVFIVFFHNPDEEENIDSIMGASYYKVEQGTTNPIFLKEFWLPFHSLPVYFLNGYMYYYDFDAGKLGREQFCTVD